MEGRCLLSARKVLLVEPDPWRRESLSAFLVREGFAIHGQADTVTPYAALVNLCERAGEAKVRIEGIRARFPDAPLVAFVREVETHTVFPCLLMGVKGVLPFDSPGKEVLAAMSAVSSGSLWTPRPVLAQWIDRIAAMGLPEGDGTFTKSESRVLEGVRDELTNKEIAHKLGVTEATIKFHVTNLLKKTGMKHRRELTKLANEGLRIQPE